MLDDWRREANAWGSTQLHVEVVPGEVPVVRLAGELDVAGVDRLEVALDQVLASGPSVLVLDVGALRFLGSVGLSSFLRARSRVEEVTVLGCQRSVRRVFEITGLERFFSFVEAASSRPHEAAEAGDAGVEGRPA